MFVYNIIEMSSLLEREPQERLLGHFKGGKMGTWQAGNAQVAPAQLVKLRGVRQREEPCIMRRPPLSSTK